MEQPCTTGKAPSWTAPSCHKASRFDASCNLLSFYQHAIAIWPRFALQLLSSLTCYIGIHDLMHKVLSGATELLLQVYASGSPGCYSRLRHDCVVCHKLITAAPHDLLHCYQAFLKNREGFAQADVMRVNVSPQHLKEHAADKLDGPGAVVATSIDHQLVAPVLPWKVSEEEVRSGLADYGSHHVLHLTGTGVIAMDNHRRWERRMSHATHDRWRHTLF